MLISRRETLAYSSALTALSGVPASAMATAPRVSTIARSQSVQHLLIHRDEADGHPVCATLSLAAPDTAWKTAGMLEESALHEATASYRLRGYALRRVNAFQTRQGVRYAAVWQLGRAAPDHVETGMNLSELRAKVERLSQRGLAISQIDGANTDAGPRFSAIWEAASGASQKVLADLTGADVGRQVALHAAQGLVPLQIAGYASGSDARFAVVFGAGTAARETDLSLPASEYRLRNRAMRSAGFELRDASGYVVDGQPFLTAVWEQA